MPVRAEAQLKRIYFRKSEGIAIWPYAVYAILFTNEITDIVKKWSFILTISMLFFLSSYIPNTKQHPTVGQRIEDVSSLIGSSGSPDELTLINFWSANNPKSRVLNATAAAEMGIDPETRLRVISVNIDTDSTLATQVMRADGADGYGLMSSTSETAAELAARFCPQNLCGAYLLDHNGKIVKLITV